MKTIEKRALFWDVSAVDPQKNARFIIERILVFGDLEDFKWAVETYGVTAIKNTCEQSRVLDKKSATFWNNYFLRTA